jgi:hypothetical protein
VGKLTDNQLDVIAGKRDVLLGRIQEVYGISREEGEKPFHPRASGGRDDHFLPRVITGRKPI